MEIEINKSNIYNIEDFQYSEEYCNSSKSGRRIKNYSKEGNEKELLKDYPTLEDLKYFAGLIGVDVEVNSAVKKKKHWEELIIQHQTLWGRTKLVKGINKIPTSLPVLLKHEGLNIPAYLSFRVKANDTKYSLMPFPSRIRPYYLSAPNTVAEVSYLVLLDPVQQLKALSLEHEGFSLDLSVHKKYYNFKLDRIETLNFIWRTGKSLFITFQYLDLPHTNVHTEYIVNLQPDDLVKASVVNNYELLTKDVLSPYSITIDIAGVSVVNKICSLTRSSILTIGNYRLCLSQIREHRNAEWSIEPKIEPNEAYLRNKDKNSEFVKLSQALRTIAENPNRYYKTIESRYTQQKD